MPRVRLKDVIIEPYNYKVCDKCLSINLRENKQCSNCEKAFFSHGYETVDKAVNRVEDKILVDNDEVSALHDTILTV